MLKYQTIDHISYLCLNLLHKIIQSVQENKQSKNPNQINDLVFAPILHKFRATLTEG